MLTEAWLGWLRQPFRHHAPLFICKGQILTECERGKGYRDGGGRCSQPNSRSLGGQTSITCSRQIAPAPSARMRAATLASQAVARRRCPEMAVAAPSSVMDGVGDASGSLE